MTTELSKTHQAYILFELANTTYAIPSDVVQQMEMVEHITPVPNTLPFIEGVVFSRGQVIPAFNLRIKFGLEKKPYSLRTRLIVVHVQNRTVGIIVDTAREFLTIPNTAIQPPPESLSGMSSKFLSGIATLEKRVVLILNIEELLQLPEWTTSNHS